MLLGKLNPFGALLLRHCERAQVSLFKLIERAGLSAHSRVYYAIRPKETKRRATPLSDEELQKIAKALGLGVEASEELYLAASLEAAHERVQAHVTELQRQVLALQASDNKRIRTR